MEQQSMTTKKALLVLGVMLVLVGVTIIMPMEWFGVDTKKQAAIARKKIIFKTRDELLGISRDTNSNQIPDWKDFVLSNTSIQKEPTSKISDAELKTLNDPDNLTISFAKNIYTSSSYLKQSPDPLSPKDQTILVNNLLTEEQKRITQKTYTLADITTTEDESMNSKKAYGNKLALVLKKANTNNMGDSDLYYIQEYVKNKNPESLTFFAKKQQSTNTILQDLLTIEVPLSASLHHLILIKRLSEYERTLSNLSKMDTDPLRALSAIKEYETVYGVTILAISNVITYFKKESVTFAKSDPGYIFITP